MGKKLDRVYHALVDGASEGLLDAKLYEHVLEHCPKTSAKRIVKASLFALSDPDVRDKNVLDTIYALAIKHRVASFDTNDDNDADDEDDEVLKAPRITERSKQELASSTADISV